MSLVKRKEGESTEHLSAEGWAYLQHQQRFLQRITIQVWFEGMNRETDQDVTSGECQPAVAWGMRVKAGSWNLNRSVTKHRSECGGVWGRRTIGLDVAWSLFISIQLDWETGVVALYCRWLTCGFQKWSWAVARDFERVHVTKTTENSKQGDTGRRQTLVKGIRAEPHNKTKALNDNGNTTCSFG